jgi:hypothetical protein
MKFILFTVLYFNFQYLYADFKLAPVPIPIHDKAHALPAVWVDFINVEYYLIFDVKKKTAYSYSIIKFKMNKKGYPIYDSVTDPFSIKIDGVSYQDKVILTSNKITTIRYIDHVFPANNGNEFYELEIMAPIDSGVQFTKSGVSVNFFMNDLKDRQFLEKYLPTNLEYDRYKFKINTTVLGAKDNLRLLTNGKLVSQESNVWTHEYPSFYNSASLFFHLIPVKDYEIVDFDFTSISGKKIPITVYSTDLSAHARKNKSLTYKTQKK